MVRTPKDDDYSDKEETEKRFRAAFIGARAAAAAKPDRGTNPKKVKGQLKRKRKSKTLD